ncbi:serine/threonine protein phosphatase PrpC [Flavobacterium chryseum]|uniref:PP2C family protein-serine/threonine phosphatase n=1 Tax=Flavobacterium sp. P3160 TaxID=2512113 RepID=UPI00105EE8F6|nr:PP2C family serine/threonine-protein phosphatase [Flavobacterium sp. P3160]TDO77601.1 serine/threonine protein phosphatase PrpC [Flavobacterium sp. P3160]
MEIYQFTEIGPRTENQDSFGIKNQNNILIACVADGVGGANNGKFASQLSVDKFLESVHSYEDNLALIIESIHNTVLDYQEKDSNYKGMATTFTACLISKNKLKGIHLGDSRLCVLRRNGIKQLTQNHTEAKRLYKAGKLSFEEMNNYPRKNVIESAIGMKDKILIQPFYFDLEPKDRIIITSDGIHELISKIEFRDLSIKNKNLNIFGDELASLVKSKKMIDNSTFVIIEIT